MLAQNASTRFSSFPKCAHALCGMNPTPHARIPMMPNNILKAKRTNKGCLTCGVATPLWGKCEDETHTPKSGNLESSGTPTISELDCRGQNTLPWSVIYTIGKALKCRCRKWPCMSHLNICSTSYGQKKGRESNWQFDSWPQKVGNRPDPGVCRWSPTHCWKALEKSYKFSLDLIPIRGLSREL